MKNLTSILEALILSGAIGTVACGGADEGGAQSAAPAPAPAPATTGGEQSCSGDARGGESSCAAAREQDCRAHAADGTENDCRVSGDGGGS